MVGEVMITCEKIRYTCKYGEGYLSADYRKVPLMLGFKSASVQYYPLGVIGCIVPWVSLLIQVTNIGMQLTLSAELSFPQLHLRRHFFHFCWQCYNC
jgi:acyl-CoA reductase-like NAD-dependent aldehyde dehydrogenase